MVGAIIALAMFIFLSGIWFWVNKIGSYIVPDYKESNSMSIECAGFGSIYLIPLGADYWCKYKDTGYSFFVVRYESGRAATSSYRFIPHDNN